MAKGKKGGMTIGELAERTGLTIRNIRAYQTRGLIPPPAVRGRTGYYSDEHVARIDLTREMQADGLNLEAIRRVLENTNGSTSEIIDFTRALRAPFEEETPEIFTEAELAATWKVKKLDRRLIERAEKIGVFRSLPDGNVEVISPRLQRAAAELAELGVGGEEALAVAEKLRRYSEGVALTFVELFVKEIWEPFDRAGRPEQDWAKMRDALERMRPLASDALLAVFRITMDEATEKASERTLQPSGRKRSKKSKRAARRPSQRTKRPSSQSKRKTARRPS